MDESARQFAAPPVEREEGRGSCVRSTTVTLYRLRISAMETMAGIAARTNGGKQQCSTTAVSR